LLLLNADDEEDGDDAGDDNQDDEDVDDDDEDTNDEGEICLSYVHKPHFVGFCNSFILSQDGQWQMKNDDNKEEDEDELASHVLCICNFLLDWHEDEKMA
jgi:hypothetical protein